MDLYERFLEGKVKHYEEESRSMRKEKNINAKRMSNILLGAFQEALDVYRAFLMVKEEE